MTTDPMPYIISAAMVGTALGYGTARWQFRHLIKRANADLRAIRFPHLSQKAREDLCRKE